MGAPLVAALATLGCKVNHYETEAMRERLAADGFTIVPFDEKADVYIVNTCTVTAVSDAKSRRLLHRAHRANPDALIVACGCYAKMEAHAVSQLDGVGLVLGTDGRNDIAKSVRQALAARTGCTAQAPTDAMLAQEAPAFECLTSVCDGRTRATLKIQDGCVNFCSYCIIPYARGPLRSRPLDNVASELTALAAAGYREVVLSGIHLASYGRDLGNCDLYDVLRLACHTDGVERVRLGSLEPMFADERFAAFAADHKTLCPQFHLSLQSGCDEILKRMHRRYTAAQFASSVSLLKNALPNCAITTDMIAGFPGETEDMHRDSVAFAERMQFARMHVFPYSARAGTVAAKLPDQVPKAVKERRAGELIALGKTMTARFLSDQIGKTVEVLAESDGTGLTGNYVRVRTSAPEGTMARVRLTAIKEDIATGEEISK